MSAPHPLLNELMLPASSLLVLRRLLRVSLGFVLLFTLVACDRIVAPDGHLQGVVFLDAQGQEVARFENITGASGRLRASVGRSTTYTVRLIAADGSRVPVDGVEFSISSPAVIIAHFATIAIDAPDRIVLHGLLPSVTSIRFDVDHGAHEEFTVREVTLEID